MIFNKSILAIVPARGGSKRLPGKNIIQFLGKPLITWTIKSANESKYIDKTIVSTDSQKIASVCEKDGFNVPFLRPKELASDSAKTIDTILHVIQNTEKQFDVTIILQPTSPLRQATDIDNALEFMFDSNSPSCVSVCKPGKPIHWSYKKNADHLLKPIFDKEHPIIQEKEHDNIFMPNGAIFIAKTKWLLKNKTFIKNNTIGYEMSKVKSIDIDTDFDLKIAKTIGDQVLNDN